MKKKNGLWLALASLVLCLGVMATGIYAVKTALLKVGGTLGFNMHECIVEVSGTIYNLAEKDVQSGSYQKTNKTISNAIMGGEKSDAVTTTNLNIGALEFYKGENIIFELTFKNLSSHSIIASFKLDEITGVKQAESALYDTLPTAKVISVGGTTSLTFALQLTDEEAYRDTTNPFNLEANFEEFEMGYDETKGYYVAMGTEDGTANGTPLRWFPFAYSKDNSTFAKIEDPTAELASGKYYFISEKVLLMYYDEGEGVWETNCNWNTGGSMSVDYRQSKIRGYVNDKKTGSVYETYGMDNFMVYNAITNRDLDGEIYTTTYADGSKTEYTTNITPNQTLWLLSKDEANNFFVDDTARQAYPVGGSTSDYTNWWLRSPDSIKLVGTSFCVWHVDSTGVCKTQKTHITDSGVRPAFQLTIY